MTSDEKKQYLHGDSDSSFSLSKFIDKKIVDIVGHPTILFDGGLPVFEITHIVLDGGIALYLEAEHDAAYLPVNAKIHNMDEETLQRFVDEG